MKMSHIGIVVNDMDGAIKVYCEFFGMHLLRRKAGVSYTEVAMIEDSVTGQRIEILLDEHADSSRFDHIAYEAEDVDIAFANLTKQGFLPEREPFDVSGGAVRTSFVRSPDGMKYEIIHYANS